MFKSTLSWALIGAASLSFPAFAEEVTKDTIVATVNGTEITMGHMLVAREALPPQYQGLPADVLYEALVDQLVQQAVLSQSLTGDQTAVNLRVDNEVRALRAATVINDMLAEGVTDEAIAQLYEERYANAEPSTEYNASHILVETEEEAKALITELAEGADFAALAREHSTGPSGPSGGSLGWFGKGMMVKPFEDAILALEVGKVAEAPVQTQFGWHVIVLNDSRQAETPALEMVQDDLAQELRQSIIEESVTSLVEAADVVRTDPSTIDPAKLSDTSLLTAD